MDNETDKRIALIPETPDLRARLEIARLAIAYHDQSETIPFNMSATHAAWDRLKAAVGEWRKG